MERYPRLPVLEPGHTYTSVTDEISSIVLSKRTPRFWWVGFSLAFLIVQLFLLAVTVLFVRGTGIWGINIPVAWGFAIINRSGGSVSVMPAL
jgi:molybdopterin-containing oxidoreductase family membrane subunit